ncbi:MAG: PD40 domain-containing protein, partial [Caldilineaceae bacterium]|nr:PD40 domain-containing protein [Caldilineaceae bacterium]
MSTDDSASSDVGSQIGFGSGAALVVFMATRDSGGQPSTELYAVPISGGQAQKLNGPLTAGGNVFGFAVADQGAHVIYVADQEVDDVTEFYSVAISGGLTSKLNAPLVAGGDLFTYRLTPDGATALYIADQETDGVAEIYAVPAAGGMPHKLAGTAQFGNATIQGVQISPDSKRVVFGVERVDDSKQYLYRLAISDSQVITLNNPLTGTDSAGINFVITPDSQWVLYDARYDDPTLASGLYRAPIGGGPSLKLSGAATTGEYIRDMVLSPDGRRIAYFGDDTQDQDFLYDLYSVAVAGGEPVLLSPQFNVQADIGFTPDSAYVLFRCCPFAALDLYQVPAAGGASVRLNQTRADVDDVQIVDYRLSSLENVVVYRGDQDTAFQFELYRAEVTDVPQLTP